MRKIRRAFEALVGNEALKSKILSDISSDTLSHAYILEGKRGSGRHTVAYLIAAALSCEKLSNTDYPLPCGECPSCRKILQKKSPDVIVVSKEGKATLGVESIRFLRSDVRVIPNDLDYKIYIIEDADDMTDQSQNAFLLTLEEPPRYVKFFLLCEDSSTLLETIRSRAQILRTEPISTEQIDEYLCRNNEQARQLKLSDKKHYGEILMSADASLGRAQELLEPKEYKQILEDRAIVRDFIDALVNNTKGEESFALIQKFESTRDRAAELLQMATTSLRDLILIKKSESVTLCFYYDRDEAISLSDNISIKKLLAVYDALNNTIQRIFANANIKLSIIKLFSDIGLL